MKIKIIILILFTTLFYLVLNQNKKLKLNIKNEQQRYYELDNKIIELKNSDEKYKNLKNFYVDNAKEINFIKIQQDTQIINNNQIYIKKFNFPFLKYTGPNAYLSYYEQKLFIITGQGNIFYSSIENLNRDNYSFNTLNSNINDFLKKEYTEKYSNSIKGILIENKKIFISLTKNNETENPCFNNSILIADLNMYNLKFQNLFEMKECADYSNATGGALSNLNNDEIIFTIGDFSSYEKMGKKWPQDINSLFGKVIKINKNNGNYEILSMGHRNPAGIYYDVEGELLFMSEHGPNGGDEINVNFLSEKKIKNYGWGVSSYGEHYENLKNREEVYVLSPLHKSHSKYGFIEPIKYFTKSIAPTKIIVNNEFIKKSNDNYTIYLATIGYSENIKYGAQSLHIIEFDKNNFSEVSNSIFNFNDRIRDMEYIKDYNMFILYLESGTLVSLSKKK